MIEPLTQRSLVEVQEELTWLRFFYVDADFGPADSDVRTIIKKRFVRAGGVLPLEYQEEE